MYKGQPYYTGQTWQDGCANNCFCQDGSIGLWTCSSVYVNILYDTVLFPFFFQKCLILFFHNNENGIHINGMQECFES